MTQKKKMDHRINAHGVKVRYIELGMWLETEWNDSPNARALVTREPEWHPQNYLGEWSFKVLVYGDDGSLTEQTVEGSQIVRVLDRLKVPEIA